MSTLLIITKYAPPVENGLSHHTRLLAQLMSRYGHIHIVSESKGEIWHDCGDRVFVHSYSRGASRRDRFNHREARTDCADVGLFRTVLRVVRNIRPDAVLLQYEPHMWGRAGIAPAAALLPLLLRMLFRVPVVVFLHELFIDMDVSPKRLAAALLQRLQLGLIGAASSALIVTNARRERMLGGLWRQKLARIPAGHVSGRKPLRHRRRAFPFRYITWFGTLSADQRLQQLLDAFELLSDRLPDLRLVLVGAFQPEEPAMAALLKEAEQRRLRERIVAQGFMPDDELSDVLSGSEANLFLAASGPSGRRGVVAAYAGSGVPIIAIDGHETDPEFKDGENVLLVQDGNVRQLAASVERLLQESALGVRLAAGAAELYRQRYSDESVAAMLRHVLTRHTTGWKGDAQCEYCSS